MRHGVWRTLGAFLIAVCVVLSAPCTGAVELKAGTAKGTITPALDKTLIGVMGKPLEGVNHDIYARVLVLNDGAHRFVIVTYDLNCLDVATPILRKRCRDELGIDAAFLVPLATHNHAAPIQIVPGNFEYGRWLADRIFGLIEEAIANEAGPVRVLFGSGNGYFLQCMGKAPVDFEVQLLKVMLGDQTVAMFFNHPSHPLQASETEIGVGHPGYAVEEVETRVRGALAMYADACGGNQFTLKGMSAPLDEVKTLGRKLGACVLAIADGPMQDVTGPLASELKVLSLPLEAPISRKEAKKLAKEIPTDIGFVPYPHEDRSTNWVRALLKHYREKIPFPTKTADWVCTDDGFLVKAYDEPREFPCIYEETIVSRIGPLVFVAMQGEVCAPIGMRIKDAFRCETPIMVGAYMGEHNLYIPTRELVRLGAYQAKVIQIQYASPVGWSPEVEDQMVHGVKKMIQASLKSE